MPVANFPQADYLALPNKFKAFVAGYGTGKTWVGCMDMAIHYMEHPRVNQGFFAPTYPQIRDIFYPTIEEVAYDFGFTVKVKEGNKEVEFYNGRNYYGTSICRSMERPGTIIGFKIGNAIVDEIDTLNMDKAIEAHRKIIARLRWNDSSVKNGAGYTTTPEGFKFMHKTFVQDIQARPQLATNYGIIHASTYDNELNLPDDYIPSLLETYPSELINAYLHGQFVNLTSGTVYYAFSRQMHSSIESVQEGENLHIGMDFNVSHMAARVYVIRNGDEWHCVDELNEIFDTPAMIDTLKERFDGHKMYVYPDASGKNRKTNNASESDIGLLEQAKFAVSANNANPRVKNRVMSVNKRFQLMKLFVNISLCPVTTMDLEQQAYDKNGEPDKSAGNDHGNDAFGYPIAYTFPIVKPVISSEIRFLK